MKFSIWPGSAAPYDQIEKLALHAEKTGWDGLWIADHFMPNRDDDNTGPTGEAWTILAALSAKIPRIRLGTLVTGNTYRHPTVLAKQAAQVDIISKGRLVFGLGAGWQENEHRAYGIEYSTVGGRMRRLEEAVQIIKSLFSKERTNFDGEFYTLKEAPLSPKPVQQNGPPLLIGGGGEKVTMRIAAQYADEWNVWGTPTVLAAKGPILEAHATTIGRDINEIQRSAQALVVHSDDPKIIEKALESTHRQMIAGNSEQLCQVIQDYIDAGGSEFILPNFNLGSSLDQQIEAYDQFMEEIARNFK